MRKTITIFTGLAKIDQNMVGTAIVFERLAYFLARAGLKINLVVPTKTDLRINGVFFYLYETNNNKRLIDRSEIVLFGAYPPTEPMRYAHDTGKKIVSYLWSLAPLGSLEFDDYHDQQKQDRLHRHIVDSYNLALKLSQKIFCRDEKARDFVLGSLITLGKANYKNYWPVRNFSRLLAIAPFGLETIKKTAERKIYRGVLPGIGADDFLLLASGGVWNWHDSQKLAEIMKNIAAQEQRIKLILQGFHNPEKNYSREARQMLALAEKYGLKERNIYFPEKWIAHRQRGNYLAEADAGITVSPNIPESNYLIKTRFYDYLAAGLPIIINRHEAFAPTVREKKLGLILDDKSNLAARQIIALARDRKKIIQIKKNISTIKKEMLWSKTLRPVVDYCLEN